MEDVGRRGQKTAAGNELSTRMVDAAIPQLPCSEQLTSILVIYNRRRTCPKFLFIDSIQIGCPSKFATSKTNKNKEDSMLEFPLFHQPLNFHPNIFFLGKSLASTITTHLAEKNPFIL